MEASDPEAKENAKTPTSIVTIQNIFSYLLLGPMSLYPTVAMVVTIK